MCIALEYLNQLSEIHNQMLADYEVLKRKQIEVERRLNKKYHEIEKQKFNAVQGYALAKELQDILQERRIVKHELNKMQTLLYKTGLQGFGEKLEKSKQKIVKIDNENKKYTKEFNVKLDSILN